MVVTDRVEKDYGGGVGDDAGEERRGEEDDAQKGDGPDRRGETDETMRDHGGDVGVGEGGAEGEGGGDREQHAAVDGPPRLHVTLAVTLVVTWQLMARHTCTLRWPLRWSSRGS